eukprot:Sspe_Gene.25541::Locus_10296_Transcript_1_1_Confidence_1.000_Length_2005::g.25541::m.25541
MAVPLRRNASNMFGSGGSGDEGPLCASFTEGLSKMHEFGREVMGFAAPVEHSPTDDFESTMPRGSPAQPGPLPPEVVNQLLHTIQLALIRGVGCVVIIASVAYIAVHTFLPVLEPLLLAALISLLTHHSASASAGHRRKFVEEVRKRLANLNKASSEYHSLARPLYLIFGNLWIATTVWQLVPKKICGFVGISRVTSLLRRHNPEHEDAIWWLETAAGLFCLTCLVVVANSNALLMTLVAFWVVGTLFMLTMDPDIASTLVVNIFMAMFIFFGAGWLFRELTSEVMEIINAASKGVAAASDKLNEAGDITELGLMYGYKGLELLAEKNNISIEAIREIAETVNHHTAAITQSPNWWNVTLYQDFVSNVKWDKVGGDDFWVETSRNLGKSTLIITQYFFVMITYIAGIATGLMWMCWSLSVTFIAVLALNRMHHTVVYNLLCLVIPSSTAAEVDHNLSTSLNSVVLSILHLFIYHFTLTYATLSYHRVRFATIGSVLAGFIALFPYFPKYYLIPAPLIVSSLHDYIQTGSSDLWELLVMIFIPWIVGDEWLFRGINPGMEPQMMVLSFVMGFYVWGYYGVVLGPLVIVLTTQLYRSMASTNLAMADPPAPSPRRRSSESPASHEKPSRLRRRRPKK